MWALLLSRFLFFIQVKERYSPGYLSLSFSLYLSISTNYLLGEKGVCTKLTWWSECSLVFQPALKVFQRKWKDKRWQSKSIFLSCFLSFEDVGFVLLMLTINCPVFYASLFASFFAAFSSLPKRTQQAHSAAAAASVAVLLACLLSWAGLWLMNSFLNGQFFYAACTPNPLSMQMMMRRNTLLLKRKQIFLHLYSSLESRTLSLSISICLHHRSMHHQWRKSWIPFSAFFCWCVEVLVGQSGKCPASTVLLLLISSVRE